MSIASELRQAGIRLRNNEISVKEFDDLFFSLIDSRKSLEDHRYEISEDDPEKEDKIYFNTLIDMWKDK